MPQVLNRRDNRYYVGVYVGRPTKWGNPFKIGKDGTREEVVKKYRLWLMDDPILMADVKYELKGHNLICWCSPLPCHADILLKIANE